MGKSTFWEGDAPSLHAFDCLPAPARNELIATRLDANVISCSCRRLKAITFDQDK